MTKNTSDNLPSTEILQFWFKNSSPQQWFVKNEEFDTLIKQKFTTITEKAHKGDYPHNNLDDYGKLALIIVLDQFSRNIYRQSPQAFATDEQALNLTKMLLQSAKFDDFTLHEKVFAYMPLEHSEDLSDQKLSVDLFEKLGDTDFLHYAMLHHDIIQRFGRFPHRNDILGRESSAEEIEFLQQPNSSF